MIGQILASDTRKDERIVTRLRCGWSACRDVIEHPGPPMPVDLDRVCGLCGGVLGAVRCTRLPQKAPLFDRRLPTSP